jgi:hypothetical protein
MRVSIFVSALLVLVLGACGVDQPGERISASTEPTSSEASSSVSQSLDPSDVSLCAYWGDTYTNVGCNHNGVCGDRWWRVVGTGSLGLKCQFVQEIPMLCSDCGSCQGHCGQSQPYGPFGGCSCASACVLNGNCCQDKIAVCGGLPHLPF